jgi:hypothetical protein
MFIFYFHSDPVLAPGHRHHADSPPPSNPTSQNNNPLVLRSITAAPSPRGLHYLHTIWQLPSSLWPPPDGLSTTGPPLGYLHHPCTLPVASTAKRPPLALFTYALDPPFTSPPYVAPPPACPPPAVSIVACSSRQSPPLRTLPGGLNRRHPPPDLVEHLWPIHST